jgi:predicted dehydrogenase
MSIGIGIIGTGGISRAHAQAYLDLPDRVRLVAVADIDGEKAREAAAQWDVEQVFDDYRDLLALDEIDAVSICTPTCAHSAPAIDALGAGKHVLVEKPMAATTAEAQRMVAAAQTSGKMLMVEMKWRFMPELLAAREAIARGDLGRIYYAEAIGWQHRGIPGGSFIRRDLAGGGALMDNGVYTLDAALYLLGHPRPLTASGTAANIFGHAQDGNWDPDAFTVEDFGTAFVRLAGGISLFFAHAWAINFEEQWQIRLAGERGAAEIRPFGPEPRLRLSRGGYSDLEDITPPSLPAGSTEVGFAVERFVEAVLEDAPSPVPGETFLYTNAIFDALYESSRLGREVSIAL